MELKRKRERAQDAIVRYIWENKLQVGDRLPSCLEISKKIGFSDATVFRSIKQLERENILESKNKVGFFVANPKTPGRKGYNFAIMVGRMHGSIMANSLAMILQDQLSKLGCNSILFHGEVGSASNLEDAITLHVGLKEQILRGEIHAIISMIPVSKENLEFLQQHNVMFCKVSGGSDYSLKPENKTVLATTFDSIAAIDLAINRVKESGYKKVAFLGSKINLAEKLSGMWKKEFEKLLLFQIDYAKTDEIIDEILSLDSADKPECLVIMDDVFAQTFYANLIQKNGINYLPPAIILKHKEIAIYLPVKADFILVSLEKMAQTSIELTLNELKKEKKSYPKVLVLPEIEKNIDLQGITK